MTDQGLPSNVADAASADGANANVDTSGQSFVPSTGDSSNATDSNGINPAWNDLLGALPDSLHSQVIPHLKSWDTGVQTKFQQVQSQYAPYKDIVGQVAPEDIQSALDVMRALNEDPQGFYSSMGEYYNLTPAQQAQAQQANANSGQGQPDEYDLSDIEPDGSNFDLEKDPRFQQLSQQQQVIAEFLSSQAEAAQAQKEDAELETALTSLKEKHGEFDEQYVLGLASNGVGLEDAVTRYVEMVNKIRSTPSPGANLPPVVTPGGGVPSTSVNPAELDKKGTQSLVMSILQNANQER